jgi:hypothetical protein
MILPTKSNDNYPGPTNDWLLKNQFGFEEFFKKTINRDFYLKNAK